MKKLFLIAFFPFIFLFATSVVAVTNITGCSNLNIQDETYYLTADILDTASNPCIEITNSSITFDCLGHTIDHNAGLNSAGVGIAIYQSYVSNVTIRNCVITEWRDAFPLECTQITASIYIDGNNNYNDTIYNVTIRDSCEGIFISGNTNHRNNTVYNVDVEVWNTCFWLYGSGSKNNTIRDSKCTSFGDGRYPIRIEQEYGGEYGYNYIYNNFINSSMTPPLVFNANSIQTEYNTSEGVGTRIYSAGTMIGGNYWTTPYWNGTSDTCTDADFDGFCDSAFSPDGIYYDYLPLSDGFCVQNWVLNSTQNQCLNSTNYIINTTYHDTNLCELPFSNYTYFSCLTGLQCQGAGICVGYCGDGACQSESLGENSQNCCTDCCGETGKTISDIGSGIGQLFTGMGAPLVIFIIVLSVGTAVGFIVASIGRRVEAKI